MSEMVERASKAAWEALEGDTHTGASWEFGTGKVNLDDVMKDRVRKMIRAAIAAMREPTQAMVDAGGGNYELPHADAYIAMIDAALKC